MGKAERWLCLAAALIGGAVGGGLSARLWPGVAAAATAASPNTVQAQKFVLVDETGRQRGLLEAQSGGPAYLVLYDQNGKRRLGLGAENTGSALNLFHSDGTTLRGALRIRPDGVSEIVVDDGRGQPRAGLAVSALGVAELP